MEIDDYLNSLNADLERQMAELNRSMEAAMNIGAMPTMDSPVEQGGSFSFCPECGTRLAPGTRFCPECGTPVAPAGGSTFMQSVTTPPSPRNQYDAQQSSGATPRNGVLFTDTEVLADKYDRTSEDITRILDRVLANMRNYGMEWKLLDAADYRDRLGRDPFWLDYNELLSDFLEDEGYAYGMQTPVFIIGGDDVIPIPMVEDPFGTSHTGQMPCDMCYCFTGNFFSDLWDGGDHAITERDVRNVVSRLPLEDGKMNTAPEEDIWAYFEHCEDYYKDGIPVEGVMMTANASWLPASRTMSEHLPLVEHADDDEDLVEDGMYVCPPVAPDCEEAQEPVGQSLEEAGMLVFNLHGSDDKGCSSFYSDWGEAFSSEQLCSTYAQVFNTVACFGARYNGYERDDSMMLTALYKHGFVLYAGSLIPVPMMELDVPDGVEVHEGSGSEHLMPIFCMEQFRGLPAGEAMMRAKLEYFNTFRHMERDDFSLATMQMFSIYGHPALRVQRNDEVLRRSEEMHVLPVLPQQKSAGAGIRMKRTQRVISGEKASGSLLSDIRSAVDANIAAIHEAVQQNLYRQFGLESRWLHHVDFFTFDGTGQKGYVYAYDDTSRTYGGKTWVEVDTTGRPLRKFTAK